MMQAAAILARILLTFFIITGATPTLASDKIAEPRQVFVRMLQAIDALNYQGTVAILKNGKLDTMRYVHTVENGVSQERLSTLNSPLSEIIRTSDKILYEFQKSNNVIITPPSVRRSFFMDLPDKVEDVDANYDFIFSGEESIALKPTQVLLIRPKDKLRYMRKIWIEKNHYLPLRFELLDSSGMALEQAVFINIEIKKTLPLVTISDTDQVNIKHIHQLKELPFSETQFVIDNLPSGFYQVFFTRRTMRSLDKLVEHLLLNDGFSSVSVYFERGNKVALAPRLTQAGAINSYARQIGENRLTVLGEVPMKTVELIAKSIRLRNPH